MGTTHDPSVDLNLLSESWAEGQRLEADADLKKQEAKEAKDRLETWLQRHRKLHAELKNGAMPLFDQPTPLNVAEVNETLREKLEAVGEVAKHLIADAWRDEPITVLESHGLSAAIVLKLVEGKIETLGALADYTEQNLGKIETLGWLSDIAGIGSASAQKIVDASERYWGAHTERGDGHRD